MTLPSRQGRSRRRRPAAAIVARRRRRGAGFLLPLAALMALLLLLGSLSVQAVSLQGKLRGASELQLQTSEDQLASAAQVLVARLQERHACLLPLAMEQWPAGGCASAAELAQLQRGEVFGVAWQLLHWQPLATPPGAAELAQRRLRLEIGLEGRDHEPGRQAGFELRLAGLPWRVQELRPLGLRGETP